MTATCDPPATCVERVAQGLKDAGLNEDWDVRVAFANAAIAAMRLTHKNGRSLGRVGACAIFDNYDGGDCTAQVVIDGWNAMVDFALKEAE